MSANMDDIARRLAALKNRLMDLDRERSDIARNCTRWNVGEKRELLVATGRYLGEGFDDAWLDKLFLTVPVFCAGPWPSMRDGCTGYPLQIPMWSSTIMSIESNRCSQK